MSSDQKSGPTPTPTLTPEQKNAQMCAAPILQYGICAELLASQSAYGQTCDHAHTNGGESLPFGPNTSDAAVALRNQSAKDTMAKCVANPGLYKCFGDMVTEFGLIEKPTMAYCRAYFNACQDK